MYGFWIGSSAHSLAVPMLRSTLMPLGPYWNNLKILQMLKKEDNHDVQKDEVPSNKNFCIKPEKREKRWKPSESEVKITLTKNFGERKNDNDEQSERAPTSLKKQFLNHAILKR